MTLSEAREIVSDPYFIPPDKYYERNREAIETITDAIDGEWANKEDLIRKLHIMEQYNADIPNWVYAVIRGA